MNIFDSIVVIVVLLILIISLYKEFIGTALSFVIAVLTLGIFNILTAKEILSGFANEQIIVIILLLVLGEIIKGTSIVELAFDKIFKTRKTYKGFMAQMMTVVAAFSAFLNNTPLVAIMMPYVHSWSKRNNVAPSKLLIPLSYAAIVGGCMTLIGTSTNLIVNGLVLDQEIIPNMPPLRLFDFIYVGLPMTIIGIFYMVFTGDKLLPSRIDSIEKFTANKREYIVEAKVTKNYPFIGKTITEAGLRNLKGLYLFQIMREEHILSALPHSRTIHEGDFLMFTGDTDSIAELADGNKGLVIPSIGMFSKKKRSDIVEVVVTHKSNLINKTAKLENFRGKYDATVLAVHRNGEKLSGKIGNIQFKAGDTLLLLVGEDFEDRSNATNNFYVISKVREIRRLGFWKTFALLGGTALAILISALGVISLFMALCILLIILLLMKVSTAKELSKGIDYELATIIAMSLALGTAMIKTGVAEMVANLVITVFIPLGKVGLLAGIYLITTILAAYITNKAAVALLFPISLTMALNLDLPPTPFALIVAYASAANFMTPIGYQTNLMVYGPGGYSFGDFMKVGGPLTVIYMVVTVLVLSFMYF